MSVKLGLDAKLYFCVAGIGGSPTWTELTNVKNVTLSLQKGEADVTTRANSGWKATAGTLKEGSIEFEMVWDTADAGFDPSEGGAVRMGPGRRRRGGIADRRSVAGASPGSLPKGVSLHDTLECLFMRQIGQPWGTVGLGSAANQH